MNYEILYERYQQGRISKSMLKIYVKKGIITQEEYESIINALINQYHPLISSLLKGINICTWYK